MYVGDYQSLDNPRLVIDRKKDLQELCGNVCQQHERFKAELVRAIQQDIKIVKRVQELSEKHNCKMSQIAIAWQWAKGVTAPIVGATRTGYLDDAANALNVKLSPEDIAYLEEMYVPHPIVGAIDKNPAEGVILLDEKK